jgi:hypothetical protein
MPCVFFFFIFLFLFFFSLQNYQMKSGEYRNTGDTCDNESTMHFHSYRTKSDPLQEKEVNGGLRFRPD